MRPLAFFLVVLLLASMAFAADPKFIQNIKDYKIPSQFNHNPDVKTLHNAYHYSGESFQIGDEIYHIIHFYRSNKLAIDGSNVGMILELGRCRSQGFRIYCFEDLDNRTTSSSITYNLQGRTASTQINRTTTRIGDGELLDRVQIGIYSIGPDVHVDRIITPPSSIAALVTSTGTGTRISGYPPDKPITIQAVIRNVGNYPAEDLTYQDAYPPFIKVTSSTGFLENNSAVLRGTLAAGEEKRITYVVEPKDFVTHTNTASVSYSFGGIYQNKSAGSFTLEMNETPYSFTFLPPLQGLANTQLDLVLTIDNKNAEKLEIKKLQITLPSNLDLIQIPLGMSWESPVLQWSGSVSYQSKQTISLPVRTSQPGRYTVSAQLELISWHNGIESVHAENKTYDIDILGNAKPLEYKFSLTPDTTNAGSSIHVTLVLLNKDRESYRYIDGTLTSTAFVQNGTILLSQINHDENKTLIDQNFATFSNNKTQTHLVFLNLTYKNQVGNVYTLQSSAYVTLNPPSHLVTVKRDVPTEVSLGEEFGVSVSITKDINQDLSLELHDERSPDIQLIAGTPYRSFDLTKKETGLQAYVYRLRVPYQYTGDDFQIITQIRAKDKNITQTDSFTIKIKRDHPLPEHEPTTQEGSNLSNVSSSTGVLNETLNVTTSIAKNTSVPSVNTTLASMPEPIETPVTPKKGVFKRFVQFFKDLF